MRRFVAALVCVSASLAVSQNAWARRSRSKIIENAVDGVAEQLGDTLVQPPKDQEVCFTPGERCEAKLLKFVQSARKSLDVAIYDINLDALVHSLLVAARAIPVRVIVDRKQAKGEKSLVKTLIRAGVEIRYGRQRGIMHNKFVLVDGAMVETGSFNYTHGAAHANNENQVYLASPAIVERYRKRFETIWGEGIRASGGRGD